MLLGLQYLAQQWELSYLLAMVLLLVVMLLVFRAPVVTAAAKHCLKSRTPSPSSAVARVLALDPVAHHQLGPLVHLHCHPQ